MSKRTRRIAIDASDTNKWVVRDTFVDLTNVPYFVIRGLNINIDIGGNDQTFNIITVWAAGIVSLGDVTQEQIDFMELGLDVFPNLDQGNVGFPGAFFAVSYVDNATETRTQNFDYAYGLTDFPDSFDQINYVPAAFVAFGSSQNNSTAQIIFGTDGFTIVNREFGPAVIGYSIGRNVLRTNTSEIDVDHYPDFLTRNGTNSSDELDGTLLGDGLFGNGGSDILNGLDGNDLLVGGASGDQIDGGKGFDTVDYSLSPAAVMINLATGVFSGGDAAGDTLANIEKIIGSAFGDSLAGGQQSEDIYGGEGNDFIDGGSNDDRLFGGTGNDTLRGGEGSDNLVGGQGADSIFGGSGIDTVDYGPSLAGVSVDLDRGLAFGGDAEQDNIIDVERILGSQHADLLIGSSLDNTLSGQDGNDMISGLGGNDILNGDAGDDILDGGSGSDFLFGGTGDDVLVGGAGADDLRGGDGFDTASYRLSNAAVNINLQTLASSGGDAAGDTFKSFGATSTEIESVEGSSFNDIIAGDFGFNTIEGGGGSDTLNGGGGTDTLSYRLSVAAVNVNLLTGAVSGGHAAGDVISNFEWLIGSAHGDQLTGNNDANTMLGGDGNDTMTGLSGGDTLMGENGNDTLFGSDGFDTLSGGVGLDLLEGGNDGDNLDGGADNDTLRGGAGSDTLIGGTGADRLEGGDNIGGSDTASYRTATSSVIASLATGQGSSGDAAGDTLIGIENLEGSDFADQLTGDGLANRLSGRGGADTLSGGAGADSLEGGTGDDTLIGGPGADFLQGETESDVLGFDRVDYSLSLQAVSIDLSTELQSGGDAQDDSFYTTFFINDFGDLVEFFSIDAVTGSASADTLFGNNLDNLIEGGGGGDTLNGRGGVDTLSYSGSNLAVMVDLATNAATGGHAQGDVVSNFENITGSSHNDTLIGNSGTNVLSGLGGNDTLNGGNGADVLDGGSGFDTARYAGFRKAYVVSTIQEASGLATRIALQSEGGTDTLRSIEEARFLDGVLTFDPASNAAKILRLFDAGLDREPGEVEYEQLLARINGGETINQLAASLVASEEFVARYGQLTNEQFIQQLYRFALNRVGESDGVAGWVALLQGGAKRGDVLLAFSETIEHVALTASELARGLWVGNETARIAARMYDAAFDRLPDSGITGWIEFLKGGQSVLAMADAFIQAPEFAQRFGNLSDREFIEQLYLVALNRPGDPAGIQAGVDFLAAGNSRAQVLESFSESAEHVRLTADLWYGGISIAPQPSVNADTLFGSIRDDAIDGLAGNDVINGLGGNDSLIGSDGEDVINGGAGNDLLRGGSASDRLDGGSGFDAAQYSGFRKTYTTSIEQQGSQISTVVRGGLEGGTDRLIDIEEARFTDGVISYDPAGIPAAVLRLYDAALDREPGFSEFELAFAQIKAGGTISQLAASLVGSQEFTSRYGQLTNQQFVEQLYSIALDRDGEPSGIAGWVAALESGGQRGDVLLAFSEAPGHIAITAPLLAKGLWVGDEFARIAARMYDSALGRLPDSGVQGWTDFLKSGQSVESMANAFIQAPEFVQRFGNLTDRQFVEQLYLFTLDRAGEATGVQGWVNSLASGGTRAQVLAGFSESAEHVILSAPLWYNGISLLNGGATSNATTLSDTGILGNNAATSDLDQQSMPSPDATSQIEGNEAKWQTALDNINGTGNAMLGNNRTTANLFNDDTFVIPDFMMPDLMVHMGRNLDHLLPDMIQ